MNNKVIGRLILIIVIIILLVLAGRPMIKYLFSNLLHNRLPPRNTFNIICISDTHNKHDRLTTTLNKLYKSPDDILIHAGDLTNTGSRKELESVNKWFGTLPYKHKIVIAGNNDGSGMDPSKTKQPIDGHKIFTNATYLENEAVTIHGLKIFGSPYTPKHYGGFQLDNDTESTHVFSQIPPDTNILVTHGPPYQILDQTSKGTHVGDTQLREIVLKIKPKLMIFGHIHNAYGRHVENGTYFINAAQYNNVVDNDATVTPVVIRVLKKTKSAHR